MKIRTVLAFLAFNAYSGSFVWAFQLNTAYLFDSDMISRLRGTGFHVSPSHWDWGNHYIWRLATAVVATALAGFLTGAIARTRGGLTAVISNVPSIATWTALIYWLAVRNVPTAYGDQIVTDHTGMIVVALVAIPVTTYVAYLSGAFGAKIQQTHFEEGTVLGITGYHWAWLIVPIYLYALTSIVPIMNLFAFEFLYNGTGAWVGSLIFGAMLMTAIVSVLPPVWVYLNLRWLPVAKTPGDMLRRALMNFVILLVGFFVVIGAQLASHWFLGKVK